MATSATLHLYKPAAGEHGWGDNVNASTDTIDAAFVADRAQLTTLTGTTASLGTRVTALEAQPVGGGGGAVYAKHTEILVTGTPPVDQITAADLGPEPVLAGRDYIYCEVTN